MTARLTRLIHWTAGFPPVFHIARHWPPPVMCVVRLKPMRLSRVEKRLAEVCDEDSFVAFVAALAADRVEEIRKEARKPSAPYGPGANGNRCGRC